MSRKLAAKRGQKPTRGNEASSAEVSAGCAEAAINGGKVAAVAAPRAAAAGIGEGSGSESDDDEVIALKVTGAGGCGARGAGSPGGGEGGCSGGELMGPPLTGLAFCPSRRNPPNADKITAPTPSGIITNQMIQPRTGTMYAT